jgi:hypothetical protein
MKAIGIVIAATLLATSGAAAAQTASDVACMIVSNGFAKNSKDPASQKAAEASLYFYLGRVSSVITPTQLKGMFDEQAKGINDKTAPAIMDGCVKAIQAKFEFVQGLSKPQNQPQGR